MGRELYAASEAARSVFDRHERMRPGTIRQCFEGDEETLADTLNAQPCLYTLSMAAAAELRARGIRPSMAAGFSLGEVAALAFAGVFGGDKGFRFVCERAERMREAADRRPGVMVAILGLEDAEVEELCRAEGRAYPANYSCPGQVSVAGDPDAVRAVSRAAARKGGRAVPIRVSGAFHCSHMDGAETALRAALGGYSLMPPEIPVFTGMTAERYGDDIGQLLAAQVSRPVRWKETVRAMVASGARVFIEAGPGGTLCSFIQRIAPGVRALRAEEAFRQDGAVAQPLEKETHA